MQNQINISPKVILPLLSVIATTIIQSPGLRPESSLTQNIIALAKIKKGFKVGVLIGPEGGFSDNEIKFAKTVGETISLGKRILRTETASITTLSMLMLHAEMNFE